MTGNAWVRRRASGFDTGFRFVLPAMAAFLFSLQRDELKAPPHS
jgi:hypothetical protein